MSTNIKPLADYVVVQQEQAEAKTASGLYLPTQAQEKPKIGKVLAVGPGRIGDDNERIPVEVAVGDTVIFGGYSNTEVKQDGQTYLLIKEDNIYATL